MQVNIKLIHCSIVECTGVHTFLYFISTWVVNSDGLVSKIQCHLHKASSKPLSWGRMWKNGFSLDNLNWKIIWQNMQLSSRIHKHQIIHFNSIHRAYFNPHTLYIIKTFGLPNWTPCNLNTLGAFIHMVWKYAKGFRVLEERFRDVHTHSV